jgi:hypothetical protein
VYDCVGSTKSASMAYGQELKVIAGQQLVTRRFELAARGAGENRVVVYTLPKVYGGWAGWQSAAKVTIRRILWRWRRRCVHTVPKVFGLLHVSHCSPARVLIPAERPSAQFRYGSAVFSIAFSTLTNAFPTNEGACLHATIYQRARRIWP